MNEIKLTLVASLYLEAERLRNKAKETEKTFKRLIAAQKVVESAAYELDMFNKQEDNAI